MALNELTSLAAAFYEGLGLGEKIETSSDSRLIHLGGGFLLLEYCQLNARYFTKIDTTYCLLFLFFLLFNPTIMTMISTGNSWIYE